MTKTILKSFLAGFMISIGCIIYTMCTSKLLGSFLFSFGLFTIVHQNLNLYTGKIGYLVDNFNITYIKELLLTLIGNIIGTLFTATIIRCTRLDLNTFISNIVEIKTTDTLLSIFILSFFCGIMMFLGVEIFKKCESYLSKILGVIFAVMVFILAGFEHCVANMFYFFFVENYNFSYLLIMILGNSLGSIFFAYILRQTQK